MPFCEKCGSELLPDAPFCQKCGSPSGTRSATPVVTARERWSGLGSDVQSMIVGIIALLVLTAALSIFGGAAPASATGSGLFSGVFQQANDTAQKDSCFANERTIEGAWSTYQANGGSDTPADFDGLMQILVPQYIKAAPRCPSGGTYTFDPSTGQVSCSIHGSVSQ